MQTRIRKLRKTRGWTLQQLADKIGTTPQTVQRLETANMTVSMDWLEKFANALGVAPADLIGTSSPKDIECLGEIGRDATLEAPNAGFSEITALSLDVPAQHPISVRITEPVGIYVAGSMLIADRLPKDQWTSAVGWDCLVELKDGTTLLRRLVMGADNNFSLIPLTPGATIQYNQQLEWVARIVMRIDYL